MIRMKRIKDEMGAVAVLVGISLATLMSLFALSVDLGHIFVTKAELQNATDSAALAAVVELRNGTEAARQKALAFGESHGVAGSYIDIEPTDVVFGHLN